jgi:EmrB/QacA subfamily drug resistance transporter
VDGAVTAVAAAPLPGRQPPRPGLVLAVCSLSVFLTGLDATIVTIALPVIGRSLHAGVSGLQWSVDAYTVTLASLLMLSGAAADRYGRRPLLQAGLSLFVLGSWLCSLAPGLGCLIAFRIIQGAGASAMNPAALGIITAVFADPARRARAIGVWDAAYGLSMVAGPVAGGILVAMAGWRAVFWASIPAGLAALALTGLVAPDSRAPRPARADPAGQVLLIVMLAALTTAIIQEPGWGWAAPQTAALAALAAAALAALAYCEPRRADPLIRFGLFRSAPFAAAIFTAVCGIAALASFGFLSTLYLQDVRDMSALRAALTICPMAAEMAVCAPLAGRLIARSGTRLPAIIAGTALTASSAALTTLTTASSPQFLTLTYSIFGAGAGLLSPVITYRVMSAVPVRQASVASGMNSASRQLGQCLGVAVTGTVLASSLHGPVQSAFVPAARTGWLIMAGCGLGVLLAGIASASPRAGSASAAARPASTTPEPGSSRSPAPVSQPPPGLPEQTATPLPRADHARPMILWRWQDIARYPERAAEPRAGLRPRFRCRRATRPAARWRPAAHRTDHLHAQPVTSRRQDMDRYRERAARGAGGVHGRRMLARSGLACGSCPPGDGITFGAGHRNRAGRCRASAGDRCLRRHVARVRRSCAHRRLPARPAVALRSRRCADDLDPVPV